MPGQPRERPYPLPPPEPPPTCSCSSHPVPPQDRHYIFDLSLLGDNNISSETPSTASTDADTLPDLASADSSSAGSFSSQEDNADTTTARVPSFSEVAPMMTGASPQVLHALYQLQRDIAIRNVSVSDYYAEQRLLEPLLHGNVPPRGHVDGGALATTIDRKDYIWSYHAYSDEERSRIPALKVADDTLHVPHGCGYVKVPCSNEPGYLFVECYHTPQIPAAILSPFAMCKALGCRRYCTISNLIDDSAQLQLRDCYHCSQDLQIDLQLIRGLLYSDPLIAPTAREHNSMELPQPAPTDTCNVIPRSLVPSVPIRCWKLDWLLGRVPGWREPIGASAIMYLDGKQVRSKDLEIYIVPF